ncbi:MAG TPA: hypothetical protein VFS51_00460 [Gemmatimonadales bacterium]|nr:hypothetical protein [Gemmatimonadales bacterium]
MSPAREGRASAIIYSSRLGPAKGRAKVAVMILAFLHSIAKYPNRITAVMT